MWPRVARSPSRKHSAPPYETVSGLSPPRLGFVRVVREGNIAEPRRTIRRAAGSRPRDRHSGFRMRPPGLLDGASRVNALGMIRGAAPRSKPIFGTSRKITHLDDTGKKHSVR